jgi:hypothetical protein
MQDLYIPAERDKPEVDFRFSQHHLSLKGESFPENAMAFYGPVVAALMDYLAQTRDAEITVDIALRYFNSSSTKILLNVFRMFDQASSNDNTVTLNWVHDPEDDTIAEFGADIANDFVTLRYNAVLAA